MTEIPQFDGYKYVGFRFRFHHFSPAIPDMRYTPHQSPGGLKSIHGHVYGVNVSATHYLTLAQTWPNPDLLLYYHLISPTELLLLPEKS